MITVQATARSMHTSSSWVLRPMKVYTITSVSCKAMSTSVCMR